MMPFTIRERSGTEAPIDVDVIDRVEIIKGPAALRSTERTLFSGSSMSSRSAGETSKVQKFLEKPPASILTAGRLSYGNKFSNGVEMLPIRFLLRQPGTPGAVLSGIRFHE